MAATINQTILVESGNSVSFGTAGNYSLFHSPGDQNNRASSTVDVSTLPTLTSVANNTFGLANQALNSLTYSFSVSGPSSAIIPVNIFGVMQLAADRSGTEAFAETGVGVQALGHQLNYFFGVHGPGGNNDPTSVKLRVLDGNYDFYVRDYGQLGASSVSESIGFNISGMVTTNQNYFVQLNSGSRALFGYSQPNSLAGQGQFAFAEGSISSAISFGANFEDASLYSINVELGVGNGGGSNSVPDSASTFFLMLVPMLGFAAIRGWRID